MELCVENLSCRRGGRLILSGLSLRVQGGTAILLRGPNGSGKTTLLRVLAGLVPATGAVHLNGVPIASRDLYLEHVAYAGHLDAIKPQLTVAENLAFWAAVYGGAPGQAMQALELDAIADRPAHACSAGQKRRLGLARLLLAPRMLWLLDEPTVSLDVETVARFAALVDAHVAGGGMALIATHVDPGLVRADTISLAPITDHVRQTETETDPFLHGSWA